MFITIGQSLTGRRWIQGVVGLTMLVLGACDAVCLRRVLAGTPAPPLFDLVLNPAGREVELVYRGSLLLNYRFSADRQLPALTRLRSLGGIDVLSDLSTSEWPHGGCFLAMTVEGVRFGTGRGSPGWQRAAARISRSMMHGETQGNSAQISHRVFWLKEVDASPREESALLVEDRQIKVVVNPGRGEVSVEWISTFEPGPDVNKVTLSGPSPSGLTLRLAPDFDLVSQRWNSAGLPYAVGARSEVTPGRWTAFRQRIEDKTISLTLFSHPANGEDSRFFSTVDPVAALAAGEGLDQDPKVYAPGERFQRRWLLTVHEGELSPEALTARWELWVRSAA